MRLFSLVVMCSLLWAGCAGERSGGGSTGAVAGSGQTEAATAGSGEIVVTPGGSIAGVVELANPNARYVVGSFPIGAVASLDTRLHVYRDGLKVGEIKITGPQRDNNIVGDIVAGEARKGDELREN